MLEKFQPSFQKIEDSLQDYFKKLPEGNYKALSLLKEAMSYGVLGGGKRFRPLLSLLVAQAFQHPEDEVLPLGVAVELIHSYSLIHDDLPTMDNDTQRRGQPTNHLVYGPAMALLAGDALQSEAFCHIGKTYRLQPEISVELIVLLSQAIGLRGMVGGQAMDMSASMGGGVEWLCQLHRMKTAALIRVCVEGAAVICRVREEIRQNLREFGEALGEAFQWADDILDHKPHAPEKSSGPRFIGLEVTKSQLDEVTQRALYLLDPLGQKAKSLREIALWNAHRVEKDHDPFRCVPC